MVAFAMTRMAAFRTSRIACATVPRAPSIRAKMAAVAFPRKHGNLQRRATTMTPMPLIVCAPQASAVRDIYTTGHCCYDHETARQHSPIVTIVRSRSPTSQQAAHYSTS